MRQTTRRDLFKMPSKIFDMGLSASELTVAAVLFSLRSRVYACRKVVKISQCRIASLCGFKSEKPVSAAVGKLCRLGVIERVDRYSEGKGILGAYVYTIPCIRGKYFFVSRRIFTRYRLSCAQMRMYLFCCKAAVSTTGCFWNSFNDIAAALNISRSSVIKELNFLVSAGLIKKSRVLKRDGSYSDNHYKVVGLEPEYRIVRKRKGRRFAHGALFKIKKFKKLKYMVMQTSANVKGKFKKRLIFLRFFAFNGARGSPKIFRTLIVPTLYHQRKETRILYRLSKLKKHTPLKR